MGAGDATRSRWSAAVIALIVLIAAVRVASTYHVFSQTIDEPIHVASGFQLLTTGRYDLDLEHPPLARVAFALLPRLAGATVDATADRVGQGNQIFYRGDRYHHNVAQARAGNLPFLILALIVLAVWTWSLFGPAVSILAVAMFSALPAMLGHAGLATTDIAVTAATPLALWALWRWMDQRTWRRAIVLAVSMAVGLTTKFSFIPYFAMAAAALIAARYLTRRGPRHTEQSTARESLRCRSLAQAVVSTVIAAVLVSASYGFSTGTVNQCRLLALPAEDPQFAAARYAAVPGYEWVGPDVVERYRHYCGSIEAQYKGADFVDWVKVAGYPSPLARRYGDTMRGKPPIPPLSTADRLLEPGRRLTSRIFARVKIPAPGFFLGAYYVQRHARSGHAAFLLGDYNDHGWWYYFPVVMFFKTPIAFTLLTLIGLAVLFRRSIRDRDANGAAIAAMPLMMLIPAMASGLNIGIRHVLPVYPLLAIAAAVAAVELWKRWRVITTALLVWFVISSAAAHPDYLAWFNELAGGHPERIAIDSNLDWGQDLLRLAEVARRRHIDRLHIAYFGSAMWRRHIAGAEELKPWVCQSGFVALSEMSAAFGGDDYRGRGFRWLRQYSMTRVGRSIRLYDVPPNACGR